MSGWIRIEFIGSMLWWRKGIRICHQWEKQSGTSGNGLACREESGWCDGGI